MNTPPPVGPEPAPAGLQAPAVGLQAPPVGSEPATLGLQAPPLAPDPGSLIGGRYRIEWAADRRGRVHVATDLPLLRPVELVLLGGTPADGDPDLICALANLCHPALPRIFDVGEHEGQPFVVRELVAGPTLVDCLLGGPMESGEVARIGAELADALAHAHAHGVAHGALRSRHVRIDDNGHVHLTGLLEHSHAAGGPAADLAALGRVLRRALGPDAPSAWAHLLRRLADPDPAARPTAAAVAEALRPHATRPGAHAGGGAGHDAPGAAASGSLAGAGGSMTRSGSGQPPLAPSPARAVVGPRLRAASGVLAAIAALLLFIAAVQDAPPPALANDQGGPPAPAAVRVPAPVLDAGP